MGKTLLLKGKEAAMSVLPVVAVVLFICLSPHVSLGIDDILLFCVSAVFLILGIALFNLGADIAMTPMGEQLGSGLTKARMPLFLLLTAFLMGTVITVAEPDLSVLASQLEGAIDGTLLIVTVGVGVGAFLVFAVLKILRKQKLSEMLLFFYFLLFAIAAVLAVGGNADFLSVVFDSGGVTTGPITVPFIMAFGIGIAATVGGKDFRENSFGLIALCSIGPILAVALLGLFMSGETAYVSPDYSASAHLGENFLPTVFSTVSEVALALGLLVFCFLVLQIVFLRLPRRKLLKMAIGVLYTFFGLVVFLSAVTVGFLPIGYRLGADLSENPLLLVVFALFLGALTVFAEPAVRVLNRQVEEVTDRTVSKRSMMIALSLGVGVSLALSMIRIIFDFSILYYLVPGYLISLGLSFFVPGLYTAIAFDSGGVASGPLTSGFILPFAIGACCALQGDARVFSDAFGIVAMVAMTPLITIQLLGFRAIVRKKVSDSVAMKRILSSDDEEIIRFM